MVKKGIFRDGQEVTATDFGNMPLFAQEHGDIIAADGIGDGFYYSDLDVTLDAEDAFTIIIAPGFVWAEGLIFERPAAIDIGGQTERYNLLQYVPTTYERIVAVIGFGVPIDTDFQPRETILNVLSDGTETRESRSVPMINLRLANVDFLPGTESVSPEAPPISAGAVHFCNVYIGPGGITRIEMITDNLVPSAARNALLIRELLARLAAQESVIEGLLSELAKLYELLKNPASSDQVIELAITAARLKERLNLPDSYNTFSADYFVGLDETDVNYAGYAALVEFGLLFPFAASVTQAIALDNPSDPAATISPLDFVLPNYTEVVKFKPQSREGDIAVSIAESTTYETRSSKVSTWVHAQGWTYQTYKNWFETTWNLDRDGRSYPLGQFAHSEDTFVAEWTVEWLKAWSLQDRNVTYVEETVTQVTGVLVAQTFIAPSLMWATKIGLYFTSIDNSGDVTILLTKVLNGRPLMTNVVARSIVTHGNLVSNPGVTEFSFEPALLNSGERYALAVITNGNHRIAAAKQGESGTEGTLFTGSSASGFLEGNLTKDLFFELYGAKFSAVNTNLELTPLSLAGGMDSVLAQNELAQPPGTKLTYEALINGTWRDLMQEGSDLDSVLPSTLRIRIRMSGTYDIAPGFFLKADAIRASRAATNLEHYSIVRNLPTASGNFIVNVFTQRYIASDHVLTVQLLDEGSSATYDADTTEVRAESGQDPEGRRHIMEFNTGASIVNYRLKITAQRGNPAPDNSVAPFAILEAVVVAVS